MRCLVTGGAGFIGKATANALANLNHEVTVIDDLSVGKTEGLDSRISFIEGDVRDKKIYPKEVDAIYHFAAKIDVRAAVINPSETLSVNIEGTAKLIEYAQNHRISHFIYASSGSTVYGHRTSPSNIRTKANPQCPYSLSKYVGEQLLVQYARFNASPFTILRYSNVYGPGQDPNRDTGVVAVFADRAKRKLPLIVYGGNQIRDFIHIDDVVAANVEALKQKGYYNISTGVGTSIGSLAQKFKEHYDVEIVWEEFNFAEISKSSLIPTKLGDWEPKISLDDGLATLF